MIELLKNILAVIGGIVVVLNLFESVFNLFPRFKEFKTKIWTSIAEHFQYKRFQKKAIASNIEDTVNDTVKHLQTELPKGWISKASIEWIKSSDVSMIKEGEVVLRLKPLSSQDFNLMNGIYYFFSSALFPSTSEIIPTNIKKATTLQLSKRTISNKQPYLTEKFKTDLLDKEIGKDPTIANYYGRYEEIDRCGYFTGAFIREIDEVANEARYTELRNSIDKEISDILNHLREFQQSNLEGLVDEELWTFRGEESNYGLLLVARPTHSGVKAYLKRALERVQQGVDRLYVLGCNQEKLFVRRVIQAIKDIPNYELVEIFDLHKDYRGEKNGIGALFNVVDTTNGESQDEEKANES